MDEQACRRGGSEAEFLQMAYLRGKGHQSPGHSHIHAAFMRHDVIELERFPRQGALELSVELIRRLSPDSLSVMELKNDGDVHIAEKMLRFPLLGTEFAGGAVESGTL